jgi:hypothetical protein|uniref:Uncharacterized protein n=1 Tax=viral metagenome TaxID=1070528 RepID=A0A6C0DXZ3_9ZZZZ
MSALQTHIFNNGSSLKSDMPDQTQTNVQNTRFGSYTVANYFSSSTSDAQVKFASQYPGFVASNLGVSSSVIDVESQLINKSVKERSTEKIQLFQRPFLTVPYLGKGGGDTTLESQLQQGEMIRNVKSMYAVPENTYVTNYPLRPDLLSQVTNPATSVEELAMNGWIRGGASSREY